jgi:hypothetical protein
MNLFLRKTDKLQKWQDTVQNVASEFILYMRMKISQDALGAVEKKSKK